MKKNNGQIEDYEKRIEELELFLRQKSTEIEKFRENEKLQRVLSELHSKFITGSDPRVLFDLLLSSILTFTKSEYGFIGEVHFDDDGNPYMKTHAITNIAWNERWERFYLENAPKGMVFSNLKTLFGAVMTSVQPVISNDPVNDPRSGGLPEGHPALNAFLGIPILSEDKLIGVIGLANRISGYDSKVVSFLKPVTTSCASMIRSLRNLRRRKKAEIALQEKEAMMEAIVNTAVDAIITIDQFGKIYGFNPAAERLFGYDSKEVIGRKVNMLMPAPHDQKHDSYISAYLETGINTIIGIGREVMALRKDRSTFPVELAISEVITKEGRFFTGILRDISERKEVEARKEELLKTIDTSHKNLLEILNQLRMGVATLDEDGHVTFINDICSEVMQERYENVIGKHWNTVFPFCSKGIDNLASIVEGDTSQKRKVVIEMKTSGGEKRWLDIEIRKDPRKINWNIIFIYDVTEIYSLRHQLESQSIFHGLVGKSESMKSVYQQLKKLSKVDSTVLIQGETGSGKELVARAIHAMSARKDKPFIAVNCASFSDSLISSQLFGHKKGAFTGANEDRLGIFETANGGTVFLDEVAEIPLELQANLLRVLEENEIVRVGDSKPRKIDIRLVSATNIDLLGETKKKKFRSDLYYRLHIATIIIPPLRDRRQDIPLLARFFLDRMRPSSQVSIEKRAMEALMTHRWRGNVRELRNTIEAALIGQDGNVLKLEDFPSHLSVLDEGSERPDLASYELGNSPSSKKQRLIEALKNTNGNRAEAARLLGIGRTTLYRQIKEFGLG